MSRWILYDQTFVSLNGLEDVGLLNRPFANICPLLGSLGIFFLCVGRLPACIPVIRKLFEEICFDVGRL